jgi:hypothetical protein
MKNTTYHLENIFLKQKNMPHMLTVSKKVATFTKESNEGKWAKSLTTAGLRMLNVR